MVAGRVPVGAKLGRYEIVKHLARGGMADLSVACASGMEGFARHVVIKHLRPEESEDETFVQMFLTEARLAGALNHHNIVQVHDIGEHDGTHFFTMEYVHGEDLRTLLARLSSRNEQAPVEHVVAIIASVAAALHHAHERVGPDNKPLGIVHRDVTPANILVAYDGNVKVADFGIAKATIQTVKTQAGALKGKVPYMSPEQCTGKIVDRRSDVFALGIVLYELVTVRRLFKGINEFETMSAIVDGDIPRPSKFREDLPMPLEEIILKALARKPADRYQSADAMRYALERFGETAGLRTSPSSLAAYLKQLFGERLEPWMKDAADVVRDMEIDFDRTEVGLVPVPDAPHKRELPKTALMEKARLNSIASSVIPRAPKPVAQRLVTPNPLAPKVPKPPGKKPLEFASTPRHSTDEVTAESPTRPMTDTDTAVATLAVGDTTDVSSPPPAPDLDPIRKLDPDATAIVKPLPRPTSERAKSELLNVDDLIDGEPPSRRIDRKWLVAAGVGAIALAAAIIIVMSGEQKLDKSPVNDPSPTVHVKEPPPPAPVEPPVAVAVDAAVIEPPPAVAVEPTPPPPTVAVEPTPPPPIIEPKPPTEIKPPITVAKPPTVAVKTDPPRPQIKPTKPVKPTKPAPPKWDPDALFLKKKKKP